MPAAWSTQRGWMRCGKCQGLWFGPNRSDSNCPHGGEHDAGDGSNYSLLHDPDPVPPNHQGDFRWCHKCQGLWLAPSGASSRCPAGGAHDLAGSGRYALANGSGSGSAAGQAGWRTCEVCLGLWFGADPAASTCPATSNHRAGADGVEFHVPPMVKRVRIHTKVLTPPPIPLTTMFQAFREAYAHCGVDVDWVSDETLDVPELTVVEAARCKSSDLTDEQATLFQNRNSAADGDVVVYVVQQTIPVYNGCAAHPDGKPGLILTAIASEWTLAHEVGHLLGLRHTAHTETDRLMTTGGTGNITNPPPDLVDDEVATLLTSPLLAGVDA